MPAPWIALSTHTVYVPPHRLPRHPSHPTPACTSRHPRRLRYRRQLRSARSSLYHAVSDSCTLVPPLSSVFTSPPSHWQSTPHIRRLRYSSPAKARSSPAPHSATAHPPAPPPHLKLANPAERYCFHPPHNQRLRPGVKAISANPAPASARTNSPQRIGPPHCPWRSPSPTRSADRASPGASAQSIGYPLRGSRMCASFTPQSRTPARNSRRRNRQAGELHYRQRRGIVRRMRRIGNAHPPFLNPVAELVPAAVMSPQYQQNSAHPPAAIPAPPPRHDEPLPGIYVDQLSDSRCTVPAPLQSATAILLRLHQRRDRRIRRHLPRLRPILPRRDQRPIRR